MKIMLRTADGLEMLTEIDKFRIDIHRPIFHKIRIKGFTGDDVPTVAAIRTYTYVATNVENDFPIYEEVF